MIADEIQSGLGRTGAHLRLRARGGHARHVHPRQGAGRRDRAAVGGRRQPRRARRAHARAATAAPSAATRSPCAVGRAVVAPARDRRAAAASRRPGGAAPAGAWRSWSAQGVLEVRVHGLWAGVDLDPALGTGRDLCEALARRGVLAKDTHGSTIRLSPPLTISEEDLPGAWTGSPRPSPNSAPPRLRPGEARRGGEHNVGRAVDLAGARGLDSSTDVTRGSAFGGGLLDHRWVTDGGRPARTRVGHLTRTGDGLAKITRIARTPVGGGPSLRTVPPGATAARSAMSVTWVPFSATGLVGGAAALSAGALVMPARSGYDETLSFVELRGRVASWSWRRHLLRGRLRPHPGPAVDPDPVPHAQQTGPGGDRGLRRSAAWASPATRCCCSSCAPSR